MTLAELKGIKEDLREWVRLASVLEWWEIRNDLLLEISETDEVIRKTERLIGVK